MGRYRPTALHGKDPTMRRHHVALALGFGLACVAKQHPVLADLPAPAPAPATIAASPAPVLPEPKAADPRWYDVVKLEGFVDAYASVNYNRPRPESPGPLGGGNQLRAYDVANGFALHWAGVDASVAPKPVGGTISLRFGPSALIQNAPFDDAAGLTYVKQAYASWKPGGEQGPVTIDFGKYDSPFGSEAADTQGDINYTRSFLFWWAQPLFLTGLRLDYAPSDALDFKVFAVNGWNQTTDVNRGKSVGGQVTVKPASALALTVGYLGGPEQADTCAVDPATGQCSPKGTVLAGRGGADGRWRHIVDIVVDLTPADPVHIVANADYVTEKVPDELAPGGSGGQFRWYGANLAARYAFSDVFAIGARGGWFRDENGWATATGRDLRLVDATLTLSVVPTPNLIFKLDQRLDRALGDEQPFQNGTADRAASQMTTTLGVVATTK